MEFSQDGVNMEKRVAKKFKKTVDSAVDGTHEFFTDGIFKANSDVIRLWGGTHWTGHTF